MSAEQRTPGMIFDDLVKQAQADAANQPSPTAHIEKQVNDLTQLVTKQTEALTQVTNLFAQARQDAVRQPAYTPPAAPQTSVDPFKELESLTGVAGLGTAISEATRKSMEAAYNAQMEPVRKANEAVTKYQDEHKDFNLPAFQAYVAANPDVREIVNRAEQAGAYEAAIAYGELRRSMDAKIKSEAKGQIASEKRGAYVRETRPDAQVVGASASGDGGRNVATTPLTPEQVANIYAQADAGNWKPFEETFINPTLPSEEWFQALAQS